MDLEFWQSRRVLITGHTGFKGSWLCEWLLKLGADVSGLALEPPTSPSLFDQLALADRIDHRIGDIREAKAVETCIAQTKPEIVIHMAAQPLVRRSYEEPLETYATNVMGTAHVLEACRDKPDLKAVVIVTTDKVYENREWVWGYRENEALGGYDPYSSSKAASEIVTSAYRNSFFNGNGPRIATARAGNVIGGGDWADDRLIPDAVRAFSKDEPIRIRYPEAVRPWQHVLEPLSGYLLLAEKLAGADSDAFADAWNFGPPETDARPVREILDIFTRHWPGAPGWEMDGNNIHPHEAGLLKLDCAKAASRLKWRPRLNLDAALELTAQWYLANADAADMTALTRTQIDHFMKTTEPAQAGTTKD